MADAEDALRLRPLTPADREAAWAAHAELTPEGFDFLLGADRDGSWSAYLDRLERERAGLDLPEGRVPATFLVADVGGALVGRVSVRHTLTRALTVVGGHIGFAVRPASRRRGYATAMLREALGVARSVGVTRALLTCDDDNAASIRTITRCGGVPDGTVATPDGPVRRYLVPTDLPA